MQQTLEDLSGSEDDDILPEFDVAMGITTSVASCNKQSRSIKMQICYGHTRILRATALVDL